MTKTVHIINYIYKWRYFQRPWLLIKKKITLYKIQKLEKYYSATNHKKKSKKDPEPDPKLSSPKNDRHYHQVESQSTHPCQM